jgi:hypothetical protein
LAIQPSSKLHYARHYSCCFSKGNGQTKIKFNLHFLPLSNKNLKQKPRRLLHSYFLSSYFSTSAFNLISAITPEYRPSPGISINI